MRFGRLAAATLGLAAVLAAAAPARANALVADLSDYLIAITVGFTGSKVLLYGATEGEGDVVIVVRGPRADAVVRRKEPVAGVWVNRQSVSFADAPMFYAVAANRPIDEILNPIEAARHEIGLENIDVRPAAAEAGVPVDEFRKALLRRGQSSGLYGQETLPVRFLGARLFRTSVSFPANVPTGNYFVYFYLVRDGRVVNAQTSTLVVTKLGIEAAVYDLAHERPSLYGLVAVIVAMAAGWLAGAVFRRT